MTEISEKGLSDRVNFYVLNVDRAVDRMERFKEDFAAFPIPFIRVPGIEGKTLTYPIEGHDAFMFFVHQGREARPGEIGCYLSHVKALKMFLESDKEFAMICEDDAMPIPESYEAIKQAIAYSGTWDLLRLFGGRAKTSFPYRTLTPEYHLCTSITGMTSTAAYIVNRRAAEKLVKKLLPQSDRTDSSFFHGYWGIKEATVFPNCILRNELSNTSTIEGHLKRKAKPWHIVFWTCRLFRLRVRIVRYSLQIARMLRRRCHDRQQDKLSSRTDSSLFG